jgi:hypothetical protein
MAGVVQAAVVGEQPRPGRRFPAGDAHRTPVAPAPKAGRWPTERVRDQPVTVALSLGRGIRAATTRDDPPAPGDVDTELTTRGTEVVQIVPTVLLALIIIFVMPVWPHSRGWGWPPAAILAMGLATLVLFSLTVVPE